MTNTSATGGPLQPAATPAPLEGQALSRFVQQWMVGLTGLDGTLVRPRWQPEPPDIPTAGDAWAAFGITERPGDMWPYIAHDGTGSGSDNLYRNEELKILISFYDLGINGLADQLAALFRDNMNVPQNSEVLIAAGFMLMQVGHPLVVPSLLKERWLYRVDLDFSLRRMIARNYPVLNVLSGQVTIQSQDPTGSDITVPVTIQQ